MDELINCTKKLHPLIWKSLLENIDANDNYYSVLSIVCYHRNWKSNFFSRMSSIESLFNKNADVVSESFDAVHLSFKPSCKLCQLSHDIMNITDPPNDVTECISCGSKTVYLFCSKCIHVLN